MYLIADFVLHACGYGQRLKFALPQHFVLNRSWRLNHVEWFETQWAGDGMHLWPCAMKHRRSNTSINVWRIHFHETSFITTTVSVFFSTVDFSLPSSFVSHFFFFFVSFVFTYSIIYLTEAQNFFVERLIGPLLVWLSLLLLMLFVYFIFGENDHTD